MASSVVRWLLLAPLVLSHGWNYVENGDDWAREGMGLCSGDGGHSNQSPVDLSMTSVAPTDVRMLHLKYPPPEVTLKLYNNGHTLAMTLPEVYRAGFGFVGEKSDLQSTTADVYRAWQVSFHAPSEHTMGGRRLPLEMQIVHQRVTGLAQLAVVSVLFEEDSASPSPFLDVLLAGGLPAQPWQERRVSFVREAIGSKDDDHLGFQALLAGSTFFAYDGSLTTPPCETGVRHFVRMKTQTASADQLQKITAVLKSVAGGPLGNFRRTPHNSKAGNVVVVGSVDSIGGGEEHPASAGVDHAEDHAAIYGSSADGARDTIAKTADLQRILYSDSPELQRAKEEYKQAQLAQASAMQSKEEKLLALKTAEDNFDKATGSVLKVNTKMQIHVAQQDVARATEACRAALQEVDTSAVKLVETWRSDGAKKSNPDGIARLPTTTATPTEYGSIKVATTATPYHEGLSAWVTTTPKPGPLVYPGATVMLPRGLAASPFVSDGKPDASVSISGGGSMISLGSNDRLAPNLRQLDGPEGAVPMAYRADTALLQDARFGPLSQSARWRGGLLARSATSRQQRMTP